MLNLVISYNLRIKNPTGAWVDDHFEDVDASFGFNECIGFIPNLEGYMRSLRIDLFEKIKKSGDKLSKNIEEYFEEEVGEKYSELSAVEIEKSEIQVSFLTEQEMIELDKKRTFDSKKPLKQLVERDVLSDDFDKSLNVFVGKKIDKMLDEELQKAGTENHSTKFAIWAQVHEEFKNAPKQAPPKDVSKSDFGPYD